MKRLLTFLLLMLMSYAAHALKQEDLLPPDKAFRFSAQAISADKVQLKWDIADGYYMYRDRFAFNSETEAIRMNSAAARFPDSKTKHEPNLGDMEVYYKQVVIEVPLNRSEQASTETEFRLKAKFQGCAEAGLCYPPQRKKAKLTLASLTPTTTTQTAATTDYLTPGQPGDNTREPAASAVVSLADLKATRPATTNTGQNTDSAALPAITADNADFGGLPPIPEDLEQPEALPLIPEDTATLGTLPPIPEDTVQTEVLPPIPENTSNTVDNILVTEESAAADTTPNTATSQTATTLLSKLSRITVGDDPLPIDQAFQYTLSALDQNTLTARWQIAPDHNLYRTKISFHVISPTEIQLDTPDFPTGRVVNDEFFGQMEVYENNVIIPIALQKAGTDKAEELVVETRYQGCSNTTGICYPLETKQTILSLAGLPETAALPITARPITAQNTQNDTSLNTQNDFFSGSFFGTLLAFFVVGLGLSLTPCIFPMIPILSGIIAGQNNLSAYKAFILSLTYVLASATAYALIGLAFGFFGENLQSGLQNPVAIGLFSALFVILALSMFGFFDLQMPNSIQSRLSDFSNRQRGGSLLGAAIMGFLSTLIVGPCVAPALAAALTYIADSKDAVLGASALFSMGFGMGIILLVAGTLGGHLLPRAGIWMDTTKAIFGIMLLGMAIWMLDRIVPIGITMLLTGVLLVSSGIYMGALDKLSEEAGGWDRFWKSIGLILLFYGATQLLGVSAGSTNILQPLKGVFSIGTIPSTSANPTQQHINFQRIKSNEDLDRALATARQNGQLTLLDFYADWCVDCIRMEKNVFTDPDIQATLSNVVLLQADVTQHDETDKALEKRFGIIGPPTILFFDKNSKEIKDLRMIGYENTSQFMQRIQQFTRL